MSKILKKTTCVQDTMEEAFSSVQQAYDKYSKKTDAMLTTEQFFFFFFPTSYSCILRNIELTGL